MASQAVAASAEQYFTQGHAAFHALTKNARQAKYRANWLAVEKHFEKSLKASATGPYAPKSLYYIGRVHEELGRWSGSSGEYRRALDYFERVVSRFPTHAWADDCLYRMADIEAGQLGEKDEAREHLERILAEYPKGDMRSGAKSLMAKVGKAAKPTSVVRDSKAVSAASPVNYGRTEGATGKGAQLDIIRFRSSDEYTRVVLELDQSVQYRYQLLAPSPEVGRPHRLYIDLENARMGSGVPPATSVADGILRSIRSGQFDKSTTRVVLDFASLHDYKVFPLANPFRIVVDVYSTGQDDGSTAEEPSVEPEPAPSSASSGTSSGSKPAKPEPYRPPKDSKKMAGDLLEQLGLTVKTIMLDPGHGGKDPGAIANGAQEKDINLKFAKILGQMLKEKGYAVCFTRETDEFIALEQRTAMANVKKADLFISVHCNANRSTGVHGLETYSLNLAKSKDAVRIASRENAVDPKAISDLQFILTDLMVNSKIRESRDLATDVQSRTFRQVSSKWKVKDQGTREAPFYVLMGAKMPSILIELGYLTNYSEAKRLKSDAYLNALALGIVDGVQAYKSQIERYALK